MRNRHKVLEISSILELLYEYGEKMSALCSSAWWVSRGVYIYLCCFGQETIINKTLGRAQDPRANGAWLSKLTE